jgi:hypothetical protein
MIDIDFGWSVDSKGYRLDHGRIIGNGGPKRAYRLKEFPTLYLTFAKTPQTPEGLLGFVSRFGRLTLDELPEGSKPVVGDNVKKVLPNIRMISMALEIIRGHVGNLPKWQGGSFEYDLPPMPNLPDGAKISGGIPLRGKLSASIAPDPSTGEWRLQLAPPTLLDAIWLQFGQALASNANLRQCDQCGTWFEAGAGSGRRADAKFCSDGCRIRFNSDKRSRHA